MIINLRLKKLYDSTGGNYNTNRIGFLSLTNQIGKQFPLLVSKTRFLTEQEFMKEHIAAYLTCSRSSMLHVRICNGNLVSDDASYTFICQITHCCIFIL